MSVDGVGVGAGGEMADGGGTIDGGGESLLLGGGGDDAEGSAGPGVSQPVAPPKPVGLMATSAQFQKASGYLSAEFAVTYVHWSTQRSHATSSGTLSTIWYVVTPDSGANSAM